jgi:hypothetical protein
LGKSAFVAVLTGTGITTANDTGLWSGTPGSLSEIVYEGQTAPSGGNGTLFGDILSSPFAFNDRGEIAFYNFLSGPANNGSLWFWDGASLSMIARAGNSFQVAPGDTRIISSLLFAGGSADEDGLPCGLNDVGQVTFRAAFTDGSQGIFSATPAALIAALNKKTTVGKSGNAATITIDSVAAYSYQLQRSLSPAGAGFTNIGSSQSGSTGTKLTFTDPNATGSALFYRILLGGP